jgi:cell division protein FtsW (lipid II flippase)
VTPPLPRGLADPRPVVGVGTVVWFATAVVLLVSGGPAAWMWACLTGGLLGFVGFAMIHWQRSAARRGARGARQDLL